MAYTTDYGTEIKALVDSATAADKLNLSEAFYRSIYEESKFAQERTIIPGVRSGALVPIIDDSADYTAFPEVTDCDSAECAISNGFSAEKWTIGIYECIVNICLRDFDQDFLRFFNTWKSDNDEDGLSTPLVQFIMNKFMKDANAALWRVGSVAEESSVNTLLSGSNGLFTLAEAGGGVKINLTENEEVVPTDRVYADENAVVGYLQSMYEEYIASNWYGSQDVVFEMDKRSALNYVQYLNVNGVNGTNCCVDVDKVMNRGFNLDGLNYHGIPIKVRAEYDAISTQVLSGDNPFRILLINQSNLIVGTEQTDKLQDFDLWYSKDDNKIKMRGTLNLGAALPTNDYILAI